jgi:site-specific DNA-methyltransferase (adenine-specific)
MELRELAKLNYFKSKNGILLQGDCLEWMEKLPDCSIDMILCDLPYGTTKCKWDTIIPFEPLWGQYERIIKDNGAIVLTASQPFTSMLIMSNIKLFKYCWVWNKSKAANFPQVKYAPLKIHEDVIVFAKEKTKYNPQMVTRGKERKKGGYFVEGEVAVMDGAPAKVNNVYYPKSILDYSTADNKDASLHPTQKPVELFEYLIKTYTDERETILDNTAGSCTTAVAAENTNRKWICIEKELEYCEKSRKRLEDLGFLN